MGEAAAPPRVLIVEDERDVAELYADWLAEQFAVQTAYDGESALSAIDAGVDVVLLDRRMPSMSGDEVLQYIIDQDVGCAVAMVSAVEPDIDVIGMGFDDYLVKPVSKEDLIELVRRLAPVVDAPVDVREYRANVAKRDLLADQLGPTTGGGSEQFERLELVIETFEERVRGLAEAYLDNRVDEPWERARILEQAELESLQAERAGIDDSDPLADVLDTEIEQLQGAAGGGSGDQSAKRELLAAVQGGFVADGFWVDPVILRALNEIFFGKYGEELVVDFHRIKPEDPPTGVELFEASKAVRDLAASELETMDGHPPSGG